MACSVSLSPASDARQCSSIAALVRTSGSIALSFLRAGRAVRETGGMLRASAPVTAQAVRVSREPTGGEYTGPAPPMIVQSPAQAVLSGETRLARYPVAAVPADRAIPAQPAQPELQLLWLHEVLDHAERAAIAQPPLDDLIPARHIGLLPAFIDVLVDEQHPSVLGQQAPQQLPELPEPARRHMREPRREEDHVEPGTRVPREHVGNLKADTCRPHAVTSDRHRLGRRINS